MFLLYFLALPFLTAAAVIPESDGHKCQKTSVLILGAGTAGIAAGKALSDAGTEDFLILEYNDYIGGRVAHTQFGAKPDGSPYTIEIGANWIQGTHSPGGPVNPILLLNEQSNVTNTYSNYSSILTYDETGYVDYSELLDDYEDSYSTFEQDAGYILTENLLDVSARAGLTLSGWTPGNDKHAEAVDWWEWDWEYGNTPEESSQLFGVVNYSKLPWTSSQPHSNKLQTLLSTNMLMRTTMSTINEATTLFSLD
jgi:polyamine oxidase